ncbi:MAG: hypothetical protein IJ603_07165 [Bacteroidales bacterium]|nr:hypothetical protein [Bacteroidales bacterium]
MFNKEKREVYVAPETESFDLLPRAIEPICGEGVLTFDGNIPAIAMTRNASNRVTLACETPVGLSAAAGDYKEFWFAIAPVTFSQGFTVEITDTEGNVMRQSLASSLEIQRNTVYRMAPLEVKTAAPDYTLVDLGLSVYWANSTNTKSGWPRAAYLSCYCNSGSRNITVNGDPTNEVPYNFGHLRSLGMTVRAVKEK